MRICYIHGSALVCFTFREKRSFCRGKILFVNGNPLPNTPKRTRVLFRQIAAMELKKSSPKLGKFVSYANQSITNRGFRGVFHGLISLLPAAGELLEHFQERCPRDDCATGESLAHA